MPNVLTCSARVCARRPLQSRQKLQAMQHQVQERNEWLDHQEGELAAWARVGPVGARAPRGHGAGARYRCHGTLSSDHLVADLQAIAVSV